MPCLVIIAIFLAIGMISVVTEYVTQNWQIVLAVVGALTGLTIALNRVAEAKHRREMEVLEAERRQRNIERFDRMVLSCPKCGAVARAVPRTGSIYSCGQCGFRLEGPTHDVEEIPKTEVG